MKSVECGIGYRALVALSATAIATVGGAMTAGAARAQVAYGSYVGIGAAAGLTKDAATGQGGSLQGVLAGRYRFLTAPISLRAQAFLFGNDFAVVPTVSYDVPLTWNMDAYLGAGISLPGGSGATVVGNKTAFVLQPGIDYMFPNSNLVAFGNAIFAFDAYRGSGNMAISVQGGMGIQF
ncbi:MAG: hypothetical protein KGQ93_00890 [Cyanobacteria bacterium REEB459]|nr:hypothetical protein [Cyanobacteria bacterium REEB459]